MKSFLCSVVGIFVLVVGLRGQVVKPSSVTVMAVPGYTSPYQDVRFYNTGSSELALTISVSGSVFATPENRCTNGVKPGTHCDVYVTYTPLGIETDNGSLLFAFGDQTVSVPLTGDGVQSIPTVSEMKGAKQERDVKLTVTVSAPDGYKIPDGEVVNAECWIYWGEEDPSGVLTNGKTTMYLSGCNTQGEYDDSWVCSGTYPGDSQFAPSYSGLTIKPPKC